MAVNPEARVIELRPRPANAERVLLTKEQVAERLSVSPRTIERWMGKGIPYIHPDPDSRMVRFPVAAVDEWWQGRMRGR